MTEPNPDPIQTAEDQQDRARQQRVERSNEQAADDARRIAEGAREAAEQLREGDGGFDRLQRALREAAERDQRSQNQRDTSEQLERIARQIASPDHPLDQSGADVPSMIEDVQGPRPREPIGSGRIVSERPSDPNARPARVEPITPARLREAASGAERAIEQQAVPDRRSDLVRRVFRRYSERVQPQGTSPEPRP